MSVVAANQGGPTAFLPAKLGSWNQMERAGVVAKTIDFDYPPTQTLCASIPTVRS